MGESMRGHREQGTSGQIDVGITKIWMDILLGGIWVDVISNFFFQNAAIVPIVNVVRIH